MPRRLSCQGVVAELFRLLSLLVVGHVHAEARMLLKQLGLLLDRASAIGSSFFRVIGSCCAGVQCFG